MHLTNAAAAGNYRDNKSRSEFVVSTITAPRRGCCQRYIMVNERPLVMRKHARDAGVAAAKLFRAGVYYQHRSRRHDAISSGSSGKLCKVFISQKSDGAAYPNERDIACGAISTLVKQAVS